jgi:hypothetical protein
MEDALVRYTIDGTQPSETNGILYEGEAIAVPRTLTIKAIAYREGYASSEIATSSYTINYPSAATPSFSVSPGTYTSSRTISISSSTPGATIRYTTNGNNPTASYGGIYSGSVTISSDTTLKAVAYAPGYSVSGVRSADYYIRPLGTVTGTVIDTQTGQGLGGVSVGVSGLSGYSTSTASSGYFSFGVPSGTRTLTFSRTGYTIPSISVGVGANTTTNIPQSTITANADVPSGTLRVVLTWAENPRDLDLHLVTPNSQHVYFSDKNPSGAGANLDLDDTTSYGPETITITSMQSGTYKFYVYRYAGDGTLNTSGARIQVFNTYGLLRTFTVPTSGSGDYWQVFNYNGGSISSINQISASPQ